jgi:hypothetical protein
MCNLYVGNVKKVLEGVSVGIMQIRVYAAENNSNNFLLQDKKL